MGPGQKIMLLGIGDEALYASHEVDEGEEHDSKEQVPVGDAGVIQSAAVEERGDHQRVEEDLCAGKHVGKCVFLLKWFIVVDFECLRVQARIDTSSIRHL